MIHDPNDQPEAKRYQEMGMPGQRSKDADVVQNNRRAAIDYQAHYVAAKFNMTIEDARVFVEEFGVERQTLVDAVERLLHRDAKA